MEQSMTMLCGRCFRQAHPWLLGLLLVAVKLVCHIDVRPIETNEFIQQWKIRRNYGDVHKIIIFYAPENKASNLEL